MCDVLLLCNEITTHGLMFMYKNLEYDETKDKLLSIGCLKERHHVNSSTSDTLMKK